MEIFLIIWSIIATFAAIIASIYLRFLYKGWCVQLGLTCESFSREDFDQSIIKSYIERKLRRTISARIGKTLTILEEETLKIKIDQKIQEILEDFGLEESERFILNIDMERDKENEIDLKVKVQIKD